MRLVATCNAKSNDIVSYQSARPLQDHNYDIVQFEDQVSCKKIQSYRTTMGYRHN